ncbi:hypothetical protein SUDANB58_00396 [Streptomyces sp. enrichment culture]
MRGRGPAVCGHPASAPPSYVRQASPSVATEGLERGVATGSVRAAAGPAAGGRAGGRAGRAPQSPRANSLASLSPVRVAAARSSMGSTRLSLKTM